MSDFSNAQHAFDTITRQYDSLRSQGVGHREAIDFIVLEHGLQHQRRKVVALVNDHLAEVVGQSGEQFIAVVAERGTTPVHGGYPGVVVNCPDTLPEDWS